MATGLRLRAFDKLSDNSRTVGDPSLNHRESQESLHGIGADSHTGGNFFTRQAQRKMLYCLILPLGQVKLLSDCQEVGRYLIALDQKCHHWLLRVPTAWGNGK